LADVIFSFALGSAAILVLCLILMGRKQRPNQRARQLRRQAERLAKKNRKG
jgi:hypothetical protein